MAMDQETARLDALRKLALLDTPPGESFDRITRLASQIFDLPIAAISLTDSDRQWFKSRVGIEHWSIPREKAPCAQVAEHGKVLVIEDFLSDPDYHDCVLAQAGIRFYAGAPLVTRDGFGLGAMCVLGSTPRVASQAELRALGDLAGMVMAQIELHHAFGRIDPVSELPNRTQFIEDLGDLALDHPAEPRIAVLIDLIGVDELNHAIRVMGLSEIDTMVKAAARHLRSLIGPGRKAYHIGTTQFAILAPRTMDERAYTQCLATLAPEAHRLAGTERIGVPALGVAPFTLGATTPGDVLRIAQGAAQDARAAGHFFRVHSVDRDTAFQRSFTLLRDFERAIHAADGLALVYQPRIDLASGICIGAEALIRWTHPTLGPISPSEFIPLVERTSLATPTTAWVLETAVAQLARWRAAGLDLIVSVNISCANLQEPDFADHVTATLDRHGVTPSALELEVTETAVMSNAESALAQLNALVGAGIRLAIDDFGTGYSSLSYLQRLPVHVVKIDRSFVSHLDTDARQRSLVTMMIAMAKHLGHRVVAEGVETAEVAAVLSAATCDEAQGYFYARPLPACGLEAWLEKATLGNSIAA